MPMQLHISLKAYSEVCFQTHLLVLDEIKMTLGPTAVDSSPTISFCLLESPTSICLHLSAIAQMLFASETAKMHPAQSMEGN